MTAKAIEANIRNTDADTAFKDSLNVEKRTTNKYLDAMQSATLDRLVADGEISRSFANMAKVDESYKSANAAANYQQLVANLTHTYKQVELMTAQIEHEYASVYQAMASAALSEAQIHKVFSDIGLNNAMIERIAHEVSEIDARTASTYQAIDESKARQALTEIQTKFQQDYYDVWKVTGFNWNSDIEKSIVGAFQNFQLKDGERMMHALEAYLESSNAAIGDGVAKSDSYMYDKVFGMFGDFVGFGKAFVPRR